MIKDGWYCCPHCGKHLFRVGDKSKAINIFVWCKKCRKEIAINFDASL